MRIGILTSGGDCPGLNAVIRGFGKYAFENIKNVQLIGIADGYGGLIRGECREMKKSDFTGHDSRWAARYSARAVSRLSS